MKYCTVYVTSAPCWPSGGFQCRTFFMLIDKKVIFVGLGKPPGTQGTRKGVERKWRFTGRKKNLILIVSGWPLKMAPMPWTLLFSSDSTWADAARRFTQEQVANVTQEWGLKVILKFLLFVLLTSWVACKTTARVMERPRPEVIWRRGLAVPMSQLSAGLK